jgi:hypothetical protein
MMRDIDLVEKTITEAQAVLHAYLQHGPRNAEQSMERLIEILDREDLAAALERLQQGFGAPRVVK